MKKILIILLLISANFIYSQSADLTLTTNITQDFINYLNNQLEICNQTIANPPSDSAAMKAYAERTLINISLINCQIDGSLKSNQTIIDSLNANNQRLENFYESNIASLNIQNSHLFFKHLLELFLDPKYGQLKSELENISQNYIYSLYSLSYNSVGTLEYTVMKLQQIKTDFNILNNNTVNFNLRVELFTNGFNGYLDFNQTHFKQLSSVIDKCAESINSLKTALDQFVQLQKGDMQASDMITSLKESISSFSSGLDSLSQIINSAPLSLLNLNTSWIADAEGLLSNGTDILNGKVFYIGSENIKTRPVALLEHSVDDWVKIILNFYRSSNRYGYTFGNLFPDALPQAVVDQLKEDMVINVTDNMNEMNSRMLALKNTYSYMLAHGQGNSSVNFGLAFTQTYLYMVELNKEIENFVGYVQGGDFRKAFEFAIINNTALADSISNNFDIASSDPNLLFTILFITEQKQQPYLLDTATNFTPMFITSPISLNLKAMTNGVINRINDVGDSFKEIYNDLDNMFNMNLDPNYLDFSNVKSPLDFILVLEKSNPNFLDITPYGISQFQKMRTTLRNTLSKFAYDVNNLNSFFINLAEYRKEFNLNSNGTVTLISGINNFVQEVNTDFQQPDSTTIINGERVNLSAWFDNPPQDLLLKFKWYFDNDPSTDNSLGGLFPDNNPNGIAQDPPQLPEAFTISQNFPNPFNPTTTINYSIPKTCMVSIKIYNILGKEIASLVNEVKNAGNYSINFFAEGGYESGGNAGRLASGTYFYRMTAGNFVETKKLILLK